MIVFLFLVLIPYISSTIERTTLKKSYSRISKKHDQNFTNLTNVFEFWANFGITLRLMKSNSCVLLPNTQKFITKPQSTLMNF